jgi:acetyltransferase-like isoleucine patch superfamily enzyme
LEEGVTKCEFLFLAIKNIIIYIYKLISGNLYDKSVVLFGIPKIIFRKHVTFGPHVRINSNVFIHAAEYIDIKEGVTLSYGVSLITTSYKTENWALNKAKKEHFSKGIKIGKYAWIGANVTVLPGVEIAEGVVVGAGSVVNQDLDQANSLYAGVPAKFIKALGDSL